MPDITDYSDIINLPHHISTVHPQMSMNDRAAQFAPFAPLTIHHNVPETKKPESEIPAPKDDF